MPVRDMIAIGASAGGVETLIKLCSLLPGDLPASVFVVVHTPANGPGLLPSILQRHSHLPVIFPQESQAIQHGTIYVAPPNWHLVLQDGRVTLTSDPSENLMRPAVDVTFRSAASAYGSRVVGVVMSGTLGDGTNGLIHIRDAGGITIVQDPQEAIFSGMPRHALQNLQPNYVLTIQQIAQKLVDLAHGREEGTPVSMRRLDNEENMLPEDQQKFRRNAPESTPRTMVTCPEFGVILLVELKDEQG